MSAIPADIANQLGELNEKQQGLIERLLATLGTERSRELLAEAQRRLAISPAPPNAPVSARAMLTSMIQTELPPDQRNVILNIQVSPNMLPPEIQARWKAVCARLNETEQQPTRLIRTLIRLAGIEAVEQAAADAEQVEAGGGMLLPDGSRRRTLGGVFFVLMRERLAPEHLTEIPMWRPKPPKPEGWVPPAQPLAPELPAMPPFVWAERTAIYQEAANEQGDANVKVTLIGRPGRVIEKQDVVITSMKMTKAPSLPKGVPAPPVTLYTVYIARKQWAKVKDAIQDASDVLIVEGVAGYDPELEGIVVSASNVTTKLLQQAKKQPAAPAEPAA